MRPCLYTETGKVACALARGRTKGGGGRSKRGSFPTAERSDAYVQCPVVWLHAASVCVQGFPTTHTPASRSCPLGANAQLRLCRWAQAGGAKSSRWGLLLRPGPTRAATAPRLTLSTKAISCPRTAVLPSQGPRQSALVVDAPVGLASTATLAAGSFCRGGRKGERPYRFGSMRDGAGIKVLCQLNWIKLYVSCATGVVRREDGSVPGPSYIAFILV